MDDVGRTARNQLFLELKPTCVKLSQLALKNDSTSAGSKELRDTAAKLTNTLEQKCRANPAFDDALADYVFFPISHILRLCQKQPVRLAELATQCVRVLLDCGWSTISVDLGQQLLLLLTLFAGGGPSFKTTEELQIEAYGALTGLYQLLNKTPKGSASLIGVSTIPALGQCLTVVLDGIVDGSSPECQLGALSALKALWSCVKDQQALSTFLPGTISALTKSLVPTIKTPRSRQVIVTALDAMRIVLTTVLGDIFLRSIIDDSETSIKGVTLTKSWLKATGSQIKLALTNVVKLRTHQHADVRMALERMCLIILDECNTSLADSASLLVETAMSVMSSAQSTEYSSQTTLDDLATIHPSVAELIKGTTYNWVIRLPHVMQSNDEAAKQSALLQLAQAHGLMSKLGIDSGVLDDAIGDSLRNSILALLESSSPSERAKEISIDEASDGTLILTDQQALQKDYGPLVMPHESQIYTRESFDILISSMGAETQVSMANDMLDFLKHASGSSYISALWLSLQLLKAVSKQNSKFDDFMSFALTASEQRELITQQLYSYSLTILVDLEDNMDWRLQAVALEVVAYTAEKSGDAFRPDLVDTLYPIVQLLGSNNGRLREHAITTLNIISISSGYRTTSDLIVDNVDYLVNSISLKLNTFDISPQAPQVLIMMIRLSGSSLLPYLDDVVGSIFAALDNFHGYPRLVDSLFSVLGEVVDESSRSGQLQPIAGPNIAHRKNRLTGENVGDIVALFETRNTRTEARQLPPHRDFPQEPWKDARSLLRESENGAIGNQEDQDTQEDVQEVPKLPPTKVYTMVQNIARLGQHYLTNQSPVLRRRLLELISTSCEGLYRNEDEFLPLVNDIWPVLVKRLYDDEAFVVTAAASAIGEIFRRAGDFMSTRVQVEWHDLMTLAKSTRNKAKTEKGGRYGRGIYAQNWQVWESLVQLMITLVEYVRVDDQMFDEILDLLGDLLTSREDIRTALSIVNADAVWLKQCRCDIELDLRTPVLDGYTFTSLDDVREIQTTE